MLDQVYLQRAVYSSYIPVYSSLHELALAPLLEAALEQLLVDPVWDQDEGDSELGRDLLIARLVVEEELQISHAQKQHREINPRPVL